MTTDKLLSSLRARGVSLTVDSGRLRVDAPAGELSETDRLAIAAAKPGLLALLTGRPPAVDHIADIRRLWREVMPLLPISPRSVVLDLGDPIGVPEIDEAAARLRLLLLTQGNTVTEALDTLVSRGVLARDERGWVRLVGDTPTHPTPHPEPRP